jgi:ketosteroid isomerase-like protein
MKIFRLTVALLAAAIFSYALGLRAAASESGAVTAVFNNAISAFNRNDMRAWIATCAPSAGIIDEIPPHSWQGAAACANWWRSFQSFASSNRMAEPSVSVGTPLHLEISGRTAYMVAPATYLYRQNGKPQREAGIFTVAFRKTLNGWLMSGWTWTLR